MTLFYDADRSTELVKREAYINHYPDDNEVVVSFRGYDYYMEAVNNNLFDTLYEFYNNELETVFKDILINHITEGECINKWAVLNTVQSVYIELDVWEKAIKTFIYDISNERIIKTNDYHYIYKVPDETITLLYLLEHQSENTKEHLKIIL